MDLTQAILYDFLCFTYHACDRQKGIKGYVKTRNHITLYTPFNLDFYEHFHVRNRNQQNYNLFTQKFHVKHDELAISSSMYACTLNKKNPYEIFAESHRGSFFVYHGFYNVSPIHIIALFFSRGKKMFHGKHGSTGYFSTRFHRFTSHPNRIVAV